MNQRPHVVVTAGGASEPIDAVRSWGNPFTGRTGMAIADAVRQFADVTVLLARSAQPVITVTESRPGKLTVYPYTTSAELAEQLKTIVLSQPAAIFMTAAVSDYRPVKVVRILEQQSLGDDYPQQSRLLVEDVGGSKIKSDYEAIAVLGVRNPKIIDMVRFDWGYKGLVYKFKLEAGVTEDELIQIAVASRKASKADVIVANTMEMVDAKTGGAWVIDDIGQRRVGRATLAAELADDLRRRMILRPATY
jgi:phosphopantothenoylcysteine synthetase/decarboxylase